MTRETLQICWSCSNRHCHSVGSQTAVVLGCQFILYSIPGGGRISNTPPFKPSTGASIWLTCVPVGHGLLWPPSAVRAQICSSPELATCVVNASTQELATCSANAWTQQLTTCVVNAQTQQPTTCVVNAWTQQLTTCKGMDSTTHNLCSKCMDSTTHNL